MEIPMVRVSKMNLVAVRETIQSVSEGRRPVTLIAVSKFQPADSIKEAYNLGQRDFGENYVQELVEKATALKETCPQIRWHFIGSLQSNKISQLIKSVDNLKSIQTVDSFSKLEKIIKTANEQAGSIDVFLQVMIPFYFVVLL